MASIRQSARTIFKDNGNNSGISMTSVDKLNINISDKDINTYAKKLGSAISKILIFFKKNHLDKEPLLKEYYDYLCVAVQVLMDMSKAKDSENVYWVNYNEDGSPFDLCFHEKSIQPYLDKLYKKRVILTSGTLSTARFDEKPYARTVKNLGLESNRRLEEGDPLETPYSFENCLIYHDPDMIAPPKNGDRTKYITALAEKVIELIKATHGKALILFTSKRDMKAVYDLVKLADLDVDLLLQNENNTNECVETFKENTNSCLFATGAFWEGIDVEGLALSNLIITKLPYPSDDPDIHAEKETLSEAEYSELLETEMILKLKQGFGRGKRSENDEVLYSILDPRFSRKINVLKSVLPTTLKYTTSMEEAQQYGQEHIVSKEKTLVA